MAKDEHVEFAKRLSAAAQGNPNVPPLHFGRLKWFVEELEKEGVRVQVEAVRKWFAGATRPKAEGIKALARILGVDAGYLATGALPEYSDRQRRQHSAAASGVVNVIAGFIQMDGGMPAFPEEDDKEARDSAIHLYAIIRGAKYNFTIVATVGDEEGRYWLVPFEAQGNAILGVDRLEPFSIQVFDLDWEMVVEKGTRKSNGYQVFLDVGMPLIETFTKRI